MTKLAIVSIFLMSFSCWAQTEVTLPAEIEVSKKTDYTLYDLVVFKQGTSEDLENLKKVSVSFLTKKGILEALKASGLKTKIVFESSLRFNTTTQINKNELQRKVANHLTAECNTCIFEIQVHKIPFLNEAALSFRSTDFDLARGSFMLPLSPEGLGIQTFATGSWKTFKKVPVTNKWMAQGHRIGVEDIKEELKEVTYLNNKLIESESLIGKQLNRAVPASIVLTREILAVEKFVKKGDSVRLLVKDGPFEIELNALAQNDGQMGDFVKVLANQKVISAKVISKDRVVSE